MKGSAATRPRDLPYSEAGLEFACTEVVEAPLPDVEVLGIDETRRGRPRWEQDPLTGKWHLVRDRWRTGFVDALGSGGPLGQVEGRTVADVLVWLAATSLEWRKSIRCVAIDMSTTYRAAAHIALPQATVAVDHFHVVQLANKMPSVVRRRTTAEVRLPPCAGSIDRGEQR